MALTTLNPTSNQTPDPGQGGNAVTGNINTGHGSTTAVDTTKTCIWTGFPAAVGQVKTVTLKADWTQDGSIPDGNNSFKIQYSLNAGSSWNNLLNSTDIISPLSGSSQTSLSTAQDLTLVRVRDSLIATPIGLAASVTGSVSNIRIEVDTIAPFVVVMM